MRPLALSPESSSTVASSSLKGVSCLLHRITGITQRFFFPFWGQVCTLSLYKLNPHRNLTVNSSCSHRHKGAEFSPSHTIMEGF